MNHCQLQIFKIDNSCGISLWKNTSHNVLLWHHQCVVWLHEYFKCQWIQTQMVEYWWSCVHERRFIAKSHAGSNIVVININNFVHFTGYILEYVLCTSMWDYQSKHRRHKNIPVNCTVSHVSCVTCPKRAPCTLYIGTVLLLLAWLR